MCWKHIRSLIPLKVLILGLFALSCKKNAPTVSFETINSPTAGNIYKSTWLNSGTGFICGGTKRQNGFIYKTNNGGLNWIKIHESTKCIYDVLFINDSIAYACGDDLLVLKSTDNGISWNEVAFSFTPEPHNIVPLRCIFGDEKLLMFAGGENFDNGNLLWMIDGNLKWVWHFDNEFRAGINFSHTNYWLLGYGTAYKSNDFGYNFKAQNLKDDFFTGAVKIDSLSAFACGYNGGIYKTTNAGKTWTEVLKKNKTFKNRIHFNAICFEGNNKGWAVGNEGVVFKTNDGNNWEEMNLNEKVNLLSIVNNQQNNLIITASNGKLYKLKN